MARDITVTFEDGTMHEYHGVPDNVTPDQIEARVRQEFQKAPVNISGGRAPAAAAAKPVARGTTGNAVVDYLTSTKPGAGIARGIVDPFIGGAQLIGKAVDKLIPGSTIGARAEKTIRGMDERTQANRAAAGETGFEGARVAGNMLNPFSWVGGGATTVPRMIATGAVQGALQPVTQGDNFLTQKALQAGLGGVAAPLVKGLVGGAAITPEAELLKKAGATQLTPGQMFGGAINQMEQVGANTLFGGAIQKAQGKSQEQFLNSQLSNVLAPLKTFGVKPPAAVGATGREAVEHTGTQIGNVYDQILPHAILEIDAPTSQALAQTVDRTKSMLTPEYQKLFDNIIKNKITDRLNVGAGRLTGTLLKDLQSDLRAQATNMLNINKPSQDNAIGQGIKDVLAILNKNMIEKSDPGVGAALSRADLAWKRFKTFQLAAEKGTAGNVTPANVSAAIKQRANKGISTEDRNLWDAAHGTLKVTPDWQSAKVINTSDLASVGLGSGALAAGVSPLTVMATIAGPLAYRSPKALRAANAIIGARPEFARQMGPVMGPLSAVGAAGMPYKSPTETEQ
jgi:hypothetical protein